MPLAPHQRLGARYEHRLCVAAAQDESGAAGVEDEPEALAPRVAPSGHETLTTIGRSRRPDQNLQREGLETVEGFAFGNDDAGTHDNRLPSPGISALDGALHALLPPARSFRVIVSAQETDDSCLVSRGAILAAHHEAERLAGRRTHRIAVPQDGGHAPPAVAPPPACPGPGNPGGAVKGQGPFTPPGPPSPARTTRSRKDSRPRLASQRPSLFVDSRLRRNDQSHGTRCGNDGSHGTRRGDDEKGKPAGSPPFPSSSPSTSGDSL